MFTIRQILVRMRQGDRDREIARSRLMGRKKLGALRNQAAQHGWLDPQQPLPDDCALAILQQHRQQAVPTQCVSTLKDHEEKIAKWAAEGLQGTTIHAALVRNHGYTGSYSVVRRVLLRVAPVKAPDATMRLIFAPGEAAQVDFGAGPAMIDPVTGEIRKTWFFVMTLCWSRHQYAEIVWNQTTMTWLACHRHAFKWFGGVPGRIIIDFGRIDIYRGLARSLGVEPSYRRAQLWKDLKERIHDLMDHKQVLPVWIIDEAQNLPPEFFRDFPAFLNFAFDSRSMLTVWLVGHPHLAQTLDRVPYAALASRIQVRIRLAPALERERFTALITHALKSAGCQHTLLSDSGLELLRQASKGFPRQAGNILHTALRLAIPKGLNHLPDDLLQAAIEALR
ncbi:AAA family ATPase [Acidithiobacillus ferriphilus]|jgi:hypothetical protein|uniref:AAA family ATPase n=1 Tax=Acidithiobacillus TaxID=119977 RepID=UPI000B108C59|nr:MULTISPECIES: AAA family ATPase [Acidithiobacillus]MEB8474864.1 AAA family ATPase [Acidithiobacillus ferriphilus]